MSTPIDLCRNYLQSQYKDTLQLDIAFADSFTQENIPVWKTINPGERMLPLETSNHGGLLMDAEIGVMLYLLPFRKGQDLTAQFIYSLGIRSRLLPEARYSETPDSHSDPHGAWRVVLHWLAESKEDREDWQDKIAVIRRETAHMEEIPVDLVCLEGFSDWEDAFAAHGFPRLLLETRAVFKHNKLSEIGSWMSADNLVEEALKDFSRLFPEGRTRELAEEVLKQMKGFSEQVSPAKPATPTATELHGESPNLLQSLTLRHFRNIEELSLKFAGNKANAYVLHGPNGTGKSSIFEALSLALFNSSNRFKDFLIEKDIASKDRPKEYRLEYLRPIGSATNFEPVITYNDENFNWAELKNDSDLAKDAGIKSNGTLLSQEMSLDFSWLSGPELGKMVLTGYSELANEIEKFVDSAARHANGSRQALLRELGLNAAITKIQTAREKITKSSLDSNEMPRLPGVVVKWLEIADSMGHPEYSFAGGLAAEWRAWGDEAVKQQLATELANFTQPFMLKAQLANWFERYNQLIDNTAKATSELEGENLTCLKQHADELIEPLRLWGAWLSRQGMETPPNHAEEIRELQSKIASLQKKQQEIVKAGSAYRSRLQHFSQIDLYLREDWAKQHPSECPTCGTDLTARQGILEVVKNLREETEAEREQHLGKYKEINASIKEIQARLVALGQQECPVSAETQGKLVQYLQWLRPDNLLSDYIRDENMRENLIKEISILRSLPQLPVKLESEKLAANFAEKLTRQFEHAAATFAEPDAWKPIQEKLTHKMSEIVASHLPETLGKLWNEILLNLTSAHWLMPKRPAFHINVKRGEQNLQIRMGTADKAPLARYILNTAEIHTMGLAWFFLRYMTFGRFHHACIVMDDPAQEMDQATFRELCRFWETLVRIHKVNNKPLSLLIMLHQEERALDAARATGGELHLLAWGNNQKPESVKKVALLGEGFAPSKPERVLEKV